MAEQAKKDYFSDSNVAMVVTFDRNGIALTVANRDESGIKEYKVQLDRDAAPLEHFRPGPLNPEGPLKNINLLKSEPMEILVWEQLDEKGNVVSSHISPHFRCRPYC